MQIQNKRNVRLKKRGYITLKLIGILLIILIGMTSVYVLKVTGTFLPKANIYVGRIVWKGNDFYPVKAKNEIAWIENKIIGRSKTSMSTFIYSLRGVKQWEKLLLIADSGDNPTGAWIQEGYEIPQGGEVTGIIFKFSGKKQLIADYDSIQKVKKWNDLEKKEGSLILDQDYQWCSVYLCYENSPIGLFGYEILKHGDDIFICKDKMRWDEKWKAGNMLIPNAEEIAFLNDLLDGY